MYLKELQLKNFRNYSDLNLKFDRTAALFFGDNAQGKTNLLESIRYISSGKSHRVTNQDDMIGWGFEFALIRAQVNAHLIELELRPGNILKIKVDKAYCRKKSDFTSILPSVIFTPEDLKIIKNGPSNRRDFLDDILESIYPGYAALKAQYQKILNQRNSLIKSIAGFESIRGFGSEQGSINPTLYAWDENLVKYGSEIIKKRCDLVNRISLDFSKLMMKFFPEIEVRIFYIFSWNRKSSELVSLESANNKPEASQLPKLGNKNSSKPDEIKISAAEEFKADESEGQKQPEHEHEHEQAQAYARAYEVFQDAGTAYGEFPQAGTSIDGIRQCFLSMLKQNLKKELSYRTTIIGPHRDDFIILLNGKDIRSFGSQGQQRIAAISLKLCEIEVIKESLKKDPVLLLDDILSELDSKREKIVLNLIKDKYQTFITTSNINYVSHIKEIEKDLIQELIVKDNNVFEVKK